MDDLLVSVAALKDHIFRKDCGPSLADCDAWRQWQRGGAAKPERNRVRKPTLVSIAKQASKAGIEVARYVIEPGKITIVVGKPGEQDCTAINEWDEVLSDGATSKIH